MLSLTSLKLPEEKIGVVLHSVLRFLCCSLCVFATEQKWSGWLTQPHDETSDMAILSPADTTIYICREIFAV